MRHWKENGQPLEETGQKGEPKQKPVLDSDFITERIKQRPINRKKLFRKMMLTAAMAVIFASVASLTFLLLEPVISNWLYPEEEPEYIEFPAETVEILPEDMISEESEASGEQENPGLLLQNSQLAQIKDSIQLGISDYSTMYHELAKTAKKAVRAVVTVTGSVSDKDWFNNPYERKDQTAGIIVARPEDKVLILLNYKNIEYADNLIVTFCNGQQAEAEWVQKDRNTSLAILSVEAEYVTEDTAAAISTADLAASSSNKAILGNPVIAIGSPLGYGESLCYGMITSNHISLDMADASYKLLTTDIYGSEDASGVLINLNGQVLGIIDNSYNKEDMKNLISAIGITELRQLIERMGNNRTQAYLGTRGTDVTPEIHETMGVPLGAYITEIEIGSPAMNAGIQSGDIITRMDDQEIHTYQDLVNIMMEEHPEETCRMTLLRQSPDGYAEVRIDVVLGER